MSSVPSIQARSVGMAYDGQTVLRNVHLTCAPGEFLSIVGPSGCGKSTLLRLFAGLASPSAGSIELASTGQQGRSQPRMGFVFQEPTLLPWRTVSENIGLPLELQGTPRENRAESVQKSLQLIGLTDDDAQKFPHMLSGGMKMRVSLARALVTEPDILLLDEPFAALDDLLRGQLNEELVSLWKHRAWTTLFVTHNVAEAVFLSQRVVVMSANPGTCHAEIEVPFEYPRNWELRGSPEFARLVGEVTGQLREAAA